MKRVHLTILDVRTDNSRNHTKLRGKQNPNTNTET